VTEQGWNHLPSSGLENLVRFLAQATDILAALASNALSTVLGFNQSSAASNQMDYNQLTNSKNMIRDKIESGQSTHGLKCTILVLVIVNLL